MPVVSHLPAEILDYVDTHAPAAEETFGISQRELAKALGYHPCSMSRPLATLVDQGHLRTRRGLVRGGQRKQLVYALTESGRAALRRQTRDVPLLSGALPPPPNPFFGRKQELQALLSYSQSGGSVVFVTGPGGMGKTALVTRHVRRLRAGRVPFWFTIRSGSSPRHFTLALAHALSAIGAQQLAYYSQLPRPPAGREVADIAQRALGDRSMLCVIDDLHAANPDIRSFLADFVGAYGSRKSDLFFFVGQEPPFFQPAGFETHEVIVGGLDRVAAHELTDRKGGLADRFEPVYQSRLGSPLLLQLAVTTPDVEATQTALPAAVVSRLLPLEVAALLPVAFANEPIPESLVTESGGLGQNRLNQWVQAGLLYRAGEGRIELLQVVRNALVARITPNDERQAHLTLASFYGRSHRPESVRERFLHLVAGEAWKLADQLLVGQERALMALGYSDTLRSAIRRLALATTAGAPKVRTLRAEAALLRLHSEYAEAILSLRRAIVESDRDPKVEAECLHQVVEMYVRLRQVSDARIAFSEALARAPPSKRMGIYALLSQARINEAVGDLPKAQLQFQEAFQRARKGRAHDLALESVAAWSRLASLGGDREAALKVVEEGLPDARASGRLDIVFNLLLVRARARAELGRADLAESEMRIIRSEAESLGYLNQLTYTLSGLAAVTAEAAHWTDSIAFARQASALAERLGNNIVLGHTLAVMALGELNRGEAAAALTHGERSVEILRRLPPSDSLPLAEAYLAEVYVAVGRTTEARACYEESIRHADAMGMSWWRERVVAEFKDKLGGPEAGGLSVS